MRRRPFREHWLRRGSATAAGVAVLGTGMCAMAAGLQVTPISLDIPAQQQGQILVLSNTGSRSIRAQVRVQRWVQTEAGEEIRATRELVASPPLVELASGERQAIRIVKMDHGLEETERAFRLFIDELPPDSPGADAQDAQRGADASEGGLQFLLRYSVPVFVAGTPRAALQTAASSPTQRPPAAPPIAHVVPRSDPSVTLLELENREMRRVKLSQVAFIASDGQRHELFAGLMGYVLAGQRMRWYLNLPLARVMAGGTFVAKLNDDLEAQPLPLEALRP